MIQKRGGRREGAGRPSGVPNKMTRPLKELAAQYTEDSIYTLVTLRDHAESEQVRLAAATALLDRGHGRPRQEIELNDKSITVLIQRESQLLTVEGLPALPDHTIVEAERVHTPS